MGYAAGGSSKEMGNVAGSTTYFCPCCFIFFSTNEDFVSHMRPSTPAPQALVQVWQSLLCFGRIPPNIPVQRGERSPPRCPPRLPLHTGVLSRDPAQQSSEVRDTGPESTDHSSHSITVHKSNVEKHTGSKYSL